MALGFRCEGSRLSVFLFVVFKQLCYGIRVHAFRVEGFRV